MKHSKIFTSMIILLLCATNFFITAHLTAAQVSASSSRPSKSSVFGSYYKIVKTIVDTKGITDEDFVYGKAGLAYAELIDFDGNGRSEMVLLTSDGAGEYMLEVWGYFNGRAQLLWNDTDRESGRIADRSLKVLKTKHASYLSYGSTYSTGLGKPPYSNEDSEHEVVFGLQNNKWSELSHFGRTYLSNPDSTVADRTVYSTNVGGKVQSLTKKQYDDKRMKYQVSNAKILVQSEAGAKSYAFDVTDSEMAIKQFVNVLKKGIAPQTLLQMDQQLQKQMILTTRNYDSVESFHGGMALVSKEGLYGFVDKNGKEIVKPQYNYASRFQEGRASVYINDKWGFIDTNGKTVIPFMYTYAENFLNGVARADINDTTQYVNKQGKVVAEPKISGFQDNPYSEGLKKIQVGQLWGFADKNGSLVIAPQYESVESFSEGIAVVYVNNKWVLLSNPLL